MVGADIARGLLLRQKLSGYYLYDLDGWIDLAAGTQKQVQLLPTLALPAKRVLVSVNNPNIDGRTNNQRQPSRPQIHFTNKADGQKYRFWP